MKTNLELVDLLRSRANVSYEDAKAALEACDYDIVEALIQLEKKDQLKKSRREQACRHENNFKKFCKEVMDIKFLIKKKRDIIMNLPLVIVGLFAIVTLPLFLVFIGIAIITGHKFQIRRGSEIIKVKKVFDDIKENINDMTEDEEPLEPSTGAEETASDKSTSQS
jgi:hypothetical protein